MAKKKVVVKPVKPEVKKVVRAVKPLLKPEKQQSYVEQAVAALRKSERKN